jgi:N-acetylmuramoyl-L-alanine amidase
MKKLAALTLPVTLLLAQNSTTTPLSVTAVRHFVLQGATRVAIEVSGPFEFRSDRLHNPERVYYDILGAVPHVVKGPRMYSEAVDDKLLLRIRVAETAKNVTRVVLDLSDNVEPSSSTLANPNRLMVELRPAGNVNPRTITAPITEPVATQAAAPPASNSVATKPTKTFTPPPPATFTPPPPAPINSAPAINPHLPSSSTKSAAAVIPPVTRPAPPPGAVPAAIEPSPEKATEKIAEKSAAAKPATGGPSAPSAEEIGAAARHTSSGQNSLIRALGLKINRVVIDPGHGGHDNGTEGPKGLLEKDLVLDVAQRLGRMVEDRMGAEVIYTRTDDTFVPLEGRTALANEKKADLFLSIHANSSNIPRIAGVETFYLNITGTRDALDIAARENASAQTSIFELQDIIKKITLHDKSEESLEFAKRIQSSLFSLSAKTIPATKDRGVKSAPFVVLIGANMPSVLAEVGFLSNAREEALLKKTDYRDKLAEAIYKGIERYASSLSHFQVAARP